jgi:hypothetical protein
MLLVLRYVLPRMWPVLGLRIKSESGSGDLGWRPEMKLIIWAQIRASSLSGECRWTREFFTRNNFTITQQHQNCVRARAVRSVMARPSCKDDVQAVKVVNEVWDSCFADTRPFDEIYR